MQWSNETGILDKIFEVFPNAVICSKTQRPPSKKSESSLSENSEFAKQVKPRKPASRASKHRFVDPRQVLLFDSLFGDGK